MEIKKIGNVIKITKVLKQNETYKINKTEKWESISFYKKPQILQGLASSTKDNQDVLFIDYDTPNQDVLRSDYKVIQERFALPQGYLLKTKKGYHIIVLKKFLPKIVHKILSYTHCDSAYTNMPLRNRYRNWVLRIGSKRKSGRPEFVGLIGEDRHYTGIISKAHKDFLSKLYPNIKHPNYKRIDKSNKIFLQEYEAS